MVSLFLGLDAFCPVLFRFNLFFFGCRFLFFLIAISLGFIFFPFIRLHCTDIQMLRANSVRQFGLAAFFTKVPLDRFWEILLVLHSLP